MTDKTPADLQADLLDALAGLTIDDLCRSANVQPDWIRTLIEHGAIEPVEQAGSEWRFTSVTLVRVAKAKRLERDLSLNPPAIALVLDLLDQLDDLRARLRRLEAR